MYLQVNRLKMTVWQCKIPFKGLNVRLNNVENKQWGQHVQCVSIPRQTVTTPIEPAGGVNSSFSAMRLQVCWWLTATYSFSALLNKQNICSPYPQLRLRVWLLFSSILAEPFYLKGSALHWFQTRVNEGPVGVGLFPLKATGAEYIGD